MSWNSQQINAEIEVCWLHHSSLVYSACRCDVDNHLKGICPTQTASNKRGVRCHVASQCFIGAVFLMLAPPNGTGTGNGRVEGMSSSERLRPMQKHQSTAGSREMLACMSNRRMAHSAYQW